MGISVLKIVGVFGDSCEWLLLRVAPKALAKLVDKFSQSGETDHLAFLDKHGVKVVDSYICDNPEENATNIFPDYIECHLVTKAVRYVGRYEVAERGLAA